MRVDQIIWGTTGVILFVAVASQTNIIKNLINKVKNPPHGFANGPSFGSNESHCYQDGQEVPCNQGYFDPTCGYFDPITDLQNEQLQQQQQQPNFTQPLVTPEQAGKNTLQQQHKKKKTA